MSVMDIVSPLPEAQWVEMLQRHSLKLRTKSKSNPINIANEMNYSEFETLTAGIIETARTSKTTRFLRNLQLSFNHIRVFTDAITTYAQVQPQPLCLIWGSIQVVLTCAVEFLSTLDLVAEMFEKLSQLLGIFNRYIHLLPTNANLLKYLFYIYDDYLGFCVTAANTLQRCSWYTPMKWLVAPIKHKFQSSQANIKRHVEEFMSEANVSFAESMIQGLRTIDAKLELSGAGPPFKQQTTKSFVPFSRNKVFLGREQELVKLHQQLFSTDVNYRDNRTTRTSVVHSMGGMGKTQLALEYTYRYKECFDYIFWLPAENGSELAQSFVRLLNLISDDDSTDANTAPSLLIQKVKHWFEHTDKHWLLVYDNFEAWDIVKPYWPCSGNGSILVTSQRAEISQLSGDHEISLQPLHRTDGARLLLKHLRRAVDETSPVEMSQAESLSDILGGLPMAISHMAGYIDKSKSSLEEFNAMYQRRDRTRRIWRQNCRTWTYQYSGTLDTLWDIALNELSPDALFLIYQLSMLNPDGISEDLLLSGRYSREELRDLLIILRDRQLVDRQITISGPFWTIHRALQINLLHRLDENVPLRQEIFEETLRLVRLHFPRQSDIQVPSNDNWEANEATLPHAIQLQKTYKQSLPTIHASSEFAGLLGDVGNYCWERALYEQGMKTLELAESMYESNPSWDMLSHSMVSTILGVLSLETGIRGRKRGLDRCICSLKLRKLHMEDMKTRSVKPSETDWVLLANAWNDVACSMLSFASYKQAEECLEKSIQIKEQLNMAEDGRAYFSFAENFKNLAIVRLSQGRYQEAYQLISRAIGLLESGGGPMRVRILEFHFELALTLFYMGDTTKACYQHEEIRKTREAMLGLYEAHTLNSYYACAFMHYTIGRFTEARKLLEASLQRSGKWTQGAICRAQFLLSKVITKETNDQLDEDARNLLKTARTMRDVLASHEFLLPMEPQLHLLDDAVAYDQIVSFDAGRMTIGQYEIMGVPIDT